MFRTFPGVIELNAPLMISLALIGAQIAVLPSSLTWSRCGVAPRSAVEHLAIDPFPHVSFLVALATNGTARLMILPACQVSGCKSPLSRFS